MARKFLAIHIQYAECLLICVSDFRIRGMYRFIVDTPQPF